MLRSIGVMRSPPDASKTRSCLGQEGFRNVKDFGGLGRWRRANARGQHELRRKHRGWSVKLWRIDRSPFQAANT